MPRILTTEYRILETDHLSGYTEMMAHDGAPATIIETELPLPGLPPVRKLTPLQKRNNWRFMVGYAGEVLR